MPRTRSALTAGDWAVLALIAEGPTHAFAVAREMAPEGEVGRLWSMRRPLVYRSVDRLQTDGLVSPSATVPSTTGPQRTLLEVTPAGAGALEAWLQEPVEHVRDARSLLLLKLLFLSRRGAPCTPLLIAQRARFAAIAERLEAAVAEADGFDATLLRWRLEAASAAVRFADAVLAGRPRDP